MCLALVFFIAGYLWIRFWVENLDKFDKLCKVFWTFFARFVAIFEFRFAVAIILNLSWKLSLNLSQLLNFSSALENIRE